MLEDRRQPLLRTTYARPIPTPLPLPAAKASRPIRCSQAFSCPGRSRRRHSIECKGTSSRNDRACGEVAFSCFDFSKYPTAQVYDTSSALEELVLPFLHLLLRLTGRGRPASVYAAGVHSASSGSGAGVRCRRRHLRGRSRGRRAADESLDANSREQHLRGTACR